jgi:hypothetical protein
MHNMLVSRFMSIARIIVQRKNSLQAIVVWARHSRRRQRQAMPTIHIIIIVIIFLHFAMPTRFGNIFARPA